jgi:hypothetical protein
VCAPLTRRRDYDVHGFQEKNKQEGHLKEPQLKKMGVKTADGTITYYCTHNDCNSEVVMLNADELKEAKLEAGEYPWWKCTNPGCPHNTPFQEPWAKDKAK